MQHYTKALSLKVPEYLIKHRVCTDIYPMQELRNKADSLNIKIPGINR